MERQEYPQPGEMGTRPSPEEFRRRFAWLSRFTDDELRRISLCDVGEMLHPREQYFDISHPEQGIIAGGEHRLVPEGGCYVARGRVSGQLWEKLTSEFRH